MNDLTLSLIQADLHWEQIDANLAMFEEMIWTIGKTDIIVLPEMFTTGFSMNASEMAEPHGGKTFLWIRQMAKQSRAAMVGSLIVKDQGQYFNRLYFVHPDGAAVHYDKRHLFNLAGEGEVYTSGSKRLIVTHKGWRIHPLICYDLRFPVWSRSRKTAEHLYEYDLLLYVANWPDTRVNAWDALLKARAIENQCYSAGVNRVGVDGVGKKYVGHSGVYAHTGETLKFSESEGVLTACLSAQDLLAYREGFPFQKDGDDFEIKS